MNYLDTVNKRTLEYFKVLESDFPEWLWEYINTEALFKTKLYKCYLWDNL